MTSKLKPLATQVVVITGATSGIGMATARMAARQGTTLVLAAHDAPGLDALAADVRRSGADVLALRVDIGTKEQLTALGRAALQRFGRIDTWINHTGAAQDAVPPHTSAFWSTVHGSIVALGAMRPHGGAIVNFNAAPTVRDDIKGFTDSLRAEIDTDGVPISVTLVRAASGDTPQQVAETILYAAQHAKRDIRVGATSRMLDQFLDLVLFRHGRLQHLSH